MKIETILKIIATMAIFAILTVIACEIHPVKLPFWGKALALFALCGIWGNKMF